MKKNKINIYAALNKKKDIAETPLTLKKKREARDLNLMGTILRGRATESLAGLRRPGTPVAGVPMEYLSHLERIAVERKKTKHALVPIEPDHPVKMTLTEVGVYNLMRLSEECTVSPRNIIERLLAPTFLVLGKTWYDETTTQWVTEIMQEGKLKAYAMGHNEESSRAVAYQLINKL